MGGLNKLMQVDFVLPVVLIVLAITYAVNRNFMGIGKLVSPPAGG